MPLISLAKGHQMNRPYHSPIQPYQPAVGSEAVVNGGYEASPDKDDNAHVFRNSQLVIVCIYARGNAQSSWFPNIATSAEWFDIAWYAADILKQPAAPTKKHENMNTSSLVAVLDLNLTYP